MLTRDLKGALGSFGAALLKPYSDQPSTNGTLIYPKQQIARLIEDFVKNVSLYVLLFLNLVLNNEHNLAGMANGTSVSFLVNSCLMVFVLERALHWGMGLRK